MNTQKDPFILKLEEEVTYRQEEILENIKDYLSQNGLLAEIVGFIYDIDNQIIKTKKDKEIRMILSNFLAIIFLYKKQLDKTFLLEEQLLKLKDNFQRILEQKNEYEEKLIELTSDLEKSGRKIRSKIQFLEAENSFLRNKNEILERKNKQLNLDIEKLMEELFQVSNEKNHLLDRFKKIKENINQIVEVKIKEKYKKFLEQLENQIRKGLEKEFKVKKAFLERKLNQKLSEVRLELSNLIIENGDLKEQLKQKEEILEELILKLGQKTIDNADLLLEKIKNLLDTFKEFDKKMTLEKQVENLKLEIEQLKQEKEILQKQNLDLKEENTGLKEVNSKLIGPFIEIYKKNL